MASWSSAVRRAAAMVVCVVVGLVVSTAVLPAQELLPRALDADFYRRPYPQLVKPSLMPAFRSLTFETEPNDDFMTANLVVLGDTVGGDISAPGDVDYFAIDLTAGERVDFDIDAFGLGSSLDAVLELYGTDGVTLRDFSNDVIGLDPRIVYQPSETGRFYLAVTDNGGGGAPTDYFYLLKATVVATGPGDPTTFFAVDLGAPLGTAALLSQQFAVVDALNVSLLQVSATGSSQLASLVTTGLGPAVDAVRDVVQDGFGNSLVAGRQNIFQSVVWRVTPAGDTTSYLGSNNAASFFSTLTVDRSGDIWLADQFDGSNPPAIVHFDPLGRFIEAVDVSAAGSEVFDIAFSPAGELHFTNGFGDVYRLSGGVPVPVIQRAGFSEGLAFDVDGYLYVADGSVGRVVLYDPVYSLVQDPFMGTNLAGPLNLVFGRDASGATTGELYALNFGVGLPPPFAGAMMAAATGSTRAPGYPVSDFLTIAMDSLRSAPVGSPYSDTLVVNAPVVSWSIIFGQLPDGLSLNEETGEIFGQPTTEGVFAFVAKVDDGSRVGFVDQVINTLAFQIAVADVANAILGLTTLPDDQTRYLDSKGNGDGILDIGDLRAYLQLIGEIPGGPTGGGGGAVRSKPGSATYGPVNLGEHDR